MTKIEFALTMLALFALVEGTKLIVMISTINWAHALAQ